jgi:ribose 5-phosphate isomerase A
MSDSASENSSPPGPRNAQKRQAAIAALGRVQSGMTVGLGSGSTAALFIAELGRALAEGVLTHVQGIPTSEDSRRLAKLAAVPLMGWETGRRCQIVVDGADEIDPSLNLIKGLGGALLREKIVAQNSDHRVIIADASKRVSRLGEKAPLPVEVVAFGHETQSEFFRSLGGTPLLRQSKSGGPFVTDNGNLIYDVKFEQISDAAALEIELLRRAGIVETGFFLGLADEVIIAMPDRVDTLMRA